MVFWRLELEMERGCPAAPMLNKLEVWPSDLEVKFRAPLLLFPLHLIAMEAEDGVGMGGGSSGFM
jgi:hypothetical protein